MSALTTTARGLAGLIAATTAAALWTSTALAAPTPTPEPSPTSTQTPAESSAPASTISPTQDPTPTSTSTPATSSAPASPSTAPKSLQPADTTPTSGATRAGRVHRPLDGATETPGRFVTANATTQALAKINLARSRVGAQPLVGDNNLNAALRAHANYLELNKGWTGLNPNAETPGRPGYTVAGAQIAPWTLVASGVGSPQAAVSLWLMDPWERSARLLHPLTRGISMMSTATFVVAAVNFVTTANQSWPQIYPAPLHNELTFNSTAVSYYTAGCSQKSSNWGYPITVQFDHQNLGALSGVRTSLYRDGVPVSYCLVWDRSRLDMDAQLVLIPTGPLKSGGHYSGQVSATAAKKSGGTTSVSATIDFTTSTTGNTTWGDQNGDAVGDLLVTDAKGLLRVYAGRVSGKISSSWVTGSGWSTFTWMSRVPDVTGDRREDLIARRGDGTMWLYAGNSMGSFSSGRQVGKGWNGLRELTVVGNMVGDANPEMVAISPKDGALLRYTITRSGITSTSVIGKNWNGVKQLAALGSFNGDSVPDVMAITSSGGLRAYLFSNKGLPWTSKPIGGGWGSFTALVGVADTTGDGRRDLIGRTADGTLWTYPARQGSFSSRIKTGTGWSGIKLFS